MSDNDWSTDPINETLPAFAAPDDPAIVLGTDLPPCMRARYSSAIFFRPPNTVSNTINRPIKFIGQVINPISGQVDEGWALWDQNDPATICGFYVYKTTIAALAPIGSGNSIPQEYYNQIAQAGSATMNAGGSTNFGSTLFGTGTGWTVNIGDGTATPAAAAFNIDGISAPRGRRGGVSSTANSAAVGAEATVLTGPAATFYNGRAYKWVLLSHLVSSVAGDNANSLVRLTNLAGPLLGFISVPSSAAGPFYAAMGEGYFVRTAGTDLTTNLINSISASAGNVTQVGAATAVRSLEYWDVGTAGQFPNAIAI